VSSAATQAGSAIRDQHCEKHNGRLYLQKYFPGFEVWIGQCDLCAEDERFERQALDILAKRKQEKFKRISERYKEDEARISKEAQVLMERDQQAAVDAIDAREEEYLDHVRRSHREQFDGTIEAEMIAEIIEELKKGS